MGLLLRDLHRVDLPLHPPPVMIHKRPAPAGFHYRFPREPHYIHEPVGPGSAVVLVGLMALAYLLTFLL